MSTLALGIDLVEVSRIAAMRAEHGRRFLDRCFTPAEQEYCLARAKRADEHLAGRFAAKEAVLKALGTGLTGGITWTEIEVTRAPDGAPGLALHAQAAQAASARAITRWLISLSHTHTHAVASVIGLGDQP